MNQKPTAGAYGIAAALSERITLESTIDEFACEIDDVFTYAEDTATVALCRAWLERNP